MTSMTMRTVFSILFMASLLFSCTGQDTSEQKKSSASTEVGQVDTYYVRVDNSEWKERVAKEPDLQLIDVRTPEEYAEGFIEGASNIDFLAPDFMENMNELDKERPLFLYCRSGGRSAQAAEALKQAGFERIVELKGGYSGWVD